MAKVVGFSLKTRRAILMAQCIVLIFATIEPAVAKSISVMTGNFCGSRRMTQFDYEIMQKALFLAKTGAAMGEVPVGAIVVCDGKIISRAHNLRESTHDATGHAEMVALREACDQLGRWRLMDCTLYVTLEPCVMCSGALSLSRIQRVIFGAFDVKGGALQSLYQILSDPRLNHRAEVQGGVLAEESEMLLRNFFEKLRLKS